MLSSSSARKNRHEYRDSVTGFYMRNRNWKHAEESHKVHESTCDIQSKLLYYLRGVIEERTIRFSGGQPTNRAIQKAGAHTNIQHALTHIYTYTSYMYTHTCEPGGIPASRYSDLWTLIWLTKVRWVFENASMLNLRNRLFSRFSCTRREREREKSAATADPPDKHSFPRKQIFMRG